jgi:SAM-dependent methyltransferase
VTRDLPALDSPVAHSPRIWNYWLGGKDNFAVDRQVGDLFRAMYPPIVDVARSSRGFLARALRHLAGPAGVRQFLDLGAGLPAAENTHQIVQGVAPDARVVYVDNDAVVLAHARALLKGGDGTAYADGDLRDPAGLLAAAARIVDLDQPVALVLANVLGHLVDLDEARRVVGELVDAVAPGSHLVVADGTTDGGPFDAAVAMWNQAGSLPYVLRTPDQIAQFFEGLELLEPGVVPCPRWRPDNGAATPHVDQYCGVGRKP